MYKNFGKREILLIRKCFKNRKKHTAHSSQNPPTPFLKVLLFFSEYCKQSYKVYTLIPDTKCKGWSRTSFDDCKQKCINNDMPDSCDKGYVNIGFRVSKGGIQN